MKRRRDEKLAIDEIFNRFTIEESDVPPRRILRNLLKFVSISVASGLAISLVATSVIALGVTASIPAVDFWKDSPSELDTTVIAARNIMYDADGKIFAQTWSENRVQLGALNDISKYARDALVATEDNSFYENPGFDFKGIARAALSGKGGGSGITQQLVKNLRFYNQLGKDQEESVERSLARKIQELKLAINYGKTHTKDEILLKYFNTVAFGGPNIYSIEASAQYFFGTSAKNLTLGEAAALVGTVKNPAAYNMAKEKNVSWKNRQEFVLSRMVAEGYITQSQSDTAAAEKFKIVKKTSGGTCFSSKYPFYCSYVLSYLEASPKLAETQEERDALISRGGLKIKTYLDPDVLKRMNKEIQKDFGNKNRAAAPAAVAQPGTGGIVAIAVNRGYGSGKGNTEINLPLNPAASGSTFKLYTLAAALNNGFTESDLQFSSQCPLRPAGYDFPAGGLQNSNGCGFQAGNLDYKHAIAWSSNTWFTTLEMKITVNKVKEFVKTVGLSAPKNIGNRSISFTLGTVENSPVSIAAANATFINDGVYCPPTPIVDYSYSDGTVPEIPETYDPSIDACRSVMSPKSASIVLKGMRANSSGEVGGAFGLDARISGHDTVTKSGTSEGSGVSWVHMSSDYSLYVTVYDPKKVSRGVHCNVRFRGSVMCGNLAHFAGVPMMKSILKGTKNTKLNYDNTSEEWKKIVVDTRTFFQVPSAIGLSPEIAVQILENTGIIVRVSKELVAAPDNFPSGVVVIQSIDAGEKLTTGSSKEIILHVSK